GERGAGRPAGADNRRSGRPVDGEGEPRARVREARRVDAGGGASPRVRRDDCAAREPVLPGDRYEEIARLYETQGRRGDAAPWRARADDLFARLQAGGPTRAVGP